jgi:hypothetical protein
VGGNVILVTQFQMRVNLTCESVLEALNKSQQNEQIGDSHDHDAAQNRSYGFRLRDQ